MSGHFIAIALFIVVNFCSYSSRLLAQSTVDSLQTNASREFSQNIKGKVVDKQTKYPITGASIIVTSILPLRGTVSDADGDFIIHSVPVGRHSVKVSYLGYGEFTMPNILLTAGKEFVLNIELEEQVNKGEDVVVVAEKDKMKPNNEMATISARSFTIEETNRYSGSRNDPARMAMNFAGVNGTSDARNDIIIRGNSPLGLLWRLEGVDIPSPNHFGAYGTTGGPVGMLNNNVLANSDFMTSAFPANYGNAISGVFDLKMRKGNSDKREYLAQLGFNGLELGAEGPFSKKSKSSYLANYRYSTLGLFKAVGISFGTSALPQYQDINFKINLPINAKHTLSIIGLGGYSAVKVDGNQTDTTDLYSDRGYNQVFNTGMGVMAIGHNYFFNPTTSLKTTLALSYSTAIAQQDSLPRGSNRKFIPSDAQGNFTGTPIVEYRSIFQQFKYSLNQNFNKKFSARNTVSVGYFVDIYDFTLADSILKYGTTSTFNILRNFNGTSSLLRAFTQWQHKFSEKVTLNSGLQYQYFAFNNAQSIEPRIGIKYKFLANQTVSLAYGLHSQLQPFQVYFKETRDTTTGRYVKSNRQLDFVKSHQMVIGYDYLFSKQMRFKLEAYYQYIYNAGVERNASSFSMLNAGVDFGIYSPDNLTNGGKGRNYGVELTLERFFRKGYYFLFTNSLFNSLYTGSDGAERNSGFNNNHVTNVLAGKEFKINKKLSVSLDFKITWAGGRRYTPIDLEKSKLVGQEIRTNQIYEAQFHDYFRPDAKLSFRLNGKRITQELYFDVQNVINRKNPFSEKYSIEKRNVVVVNQLGLFPVLQYRVTF